MKNLDIYFVGLSKNCLPTLKKNLQFINLLIKEGLKTSKIIIVDSDSNDGTKEYCSSLKSDNLLFIEEDNVKNKFQNRIEILSHCRNIGLKNIEKSNDFLYIPMDLDIDLFSLCNPKSFIELINNFQNNQGLDALFPYSQPYYYDIFALRKQGWVENNAVLRAHELKKKFRIGSFFFNYFLVFKKQDNINKFSKDLIRVESAFGGIGLYKMSKNKNYFYEINKINSTFYSEHLSFNKKFKNLFIDTNWQVPAPIEHIYYNSLGKFEKLIYILKTIKYDILGFFKKGNFD